MVTGTLTLVGVLVTGPGPEGAAGLYFGNFTNSISFHQSVQI